MGPGGELLSEDDEAKEVELTPGEHLFEVEYRTTGGANKLKFHFAGPETSSTPCGVLSRLLGLGLLFTTEAWTAVAVSCCGSALRPGLLKNDRGC